MSKVWMALHSGGKFDLLEPRVEDVKIEDIAFGLSNLNRYTGQCRYTVAEHSVLCSRAVPQEFALEALLHDAHEAYVGDVGRPQQRAMKEIMGATWSPFMRLSERVERVVRAAFGLPLEMSPEVKQVDNRIVYNERAAFFPNYTDDKWTDSTPLPGGGPLTNIHNPRGVGAKTAEFNFLDRYWSLTLDRKIG